MPKRGNRHTCPVMVTTCEEATSVLTTCTERTVARSEASGDLSYAEYRTLGHEHGVELGRRQQ